MATGSINPFGPSAPEGRRAAREHTDRRRGPSREGVDDAGRCEGVQGYLRAAGGPLAIALGTEARREKLDNEWAPVFTSGDVVGVPGGVQSLSGSRTVEALYVEASVPFAKGFEAQLAARYDHYSDFGSTVNPKIALRWQPMRSLLLRTSWGTGFRAPPLPDLYEPVRHRIPRPANSTIRSAAR